MDMLRLMAISNEYLHTEDYGERTGRLAIRKRKMVSKIND